MVAFTKRTTAPLVSDKWWRTSFNPCIAVSNGTVLPNCVGYAWGRFAEIMNGFAAGLPTCDAGNWYAVDRTHEKGKTPKLGSVLVLSRSGQSGHVAVVEEIYSDGSILTSESGYGNSWDRRFWTSKRTPPNYCDNGYTFEGFIYNPAVKGDETSLLDVNDLNHPARRFISEAEKHAGDGGHAWVQSLTSIGGGPWCAATCCAVAIACGFADVIMPRVQYVAPYFARDVVEEYGGQFIPGPVQGNFNAVPQTGDLVVYQYAGAIGMDHGYHIGMVRYCKDDTVYTVEGNSGGYVFHEKDRKGSDIGFYARPDWTKVGGSSTVSGYSGSTLVAGQLYTSESTRADASVRQVGYLDSTCKPSIKSSQIELAVINYTGMLSSFVKMFGLTAVSATTGFDNIDGLGPVPREIVQFLVNKGLPTAAAIGIIANIKAESEFNTGAIGDHGTSFGLCQWHNERGVAMKSMVGSNWAINLTGQLNYLWYELSSSSYSSLLTALQQVPNTLAGAKKAADLFVRQFERPSNIEYNSKIRQNNAETFWKQIVVVSATTGPSGDVSASQGKITTQSGKVITQGNSVSVPSSVPQTGIVANYTNYSYFYSRWSSGTIQRKLADIWGTQNKPHSYSVATLSGYYLVATSPKFGTTGDIISVVLEDNTYFNAIIGDSKGSDAPSEWGHYLGTQIDIIEWEAFATNSDGTVDQSVLREGLRSAGWLGKKVSRIVNYGSWLS